MTPLDPAAAAPADPDDTRVAIAARPAGTWVEVFVTFLRLGLTSFGGPVAHIGYFRREIVARRQWLSEAAFAEVVGLCAFLPGPASSQTGFALGLLRAGPRGGLAAWVAFTLPSAALMIGFAAVAGDLVGPVGTAMVHGLKLVAVPIVAAAVVGMARTLTPDVPRAGIAFAVAALVLLSGVPAVQIAAIGAGAVAGLVLCRPAAVVAADAAAGWVPGRRTGVACLFAYAILLAAALAGTSVAAPLPALAAIFTRAGALVFGGGHVVLPLLRASLVPRWLDDATFLAGYGAAQAVPGPLFTVAAFVGARVAGLAGAAIALVAIFLPGLLLVAGMLPLHGAIRRDARVQRALAGVNAAVVGLLAAALYDPLVTTGVRSVADGVIALAGLVLLLRCQVPPLAVVALTVAASIAVALAPALA